MEAAFHVIQSFHTMSLVASFSPVKMLLPDDAFSQLTRATFQRSHEFIAFLETAGLIHLALITLSPNRCTWGKQLGFSSVRSGRRMSVHTGAPLSNFELSKDAELHAAISTALM